MSDVAVVSARDARQLGIAAWELAALLAVLEQLVAGGLKMDMRREDGLESGRCLGAHVHAAELSRAEAAGEPAKCCRSAWTYVTWERSPTLADLYAPGRGTPGYYAHPGWDANAAQTARAVANFLAGHGRRCWNFLCVEAA